MQKYDNNLKNICVFVVFSYLCRKIIFMDAKRILKYLKQLSANNSREWFQAHKQEYDAIRADFEQGVQQAIVRIASFDPTVAHLTVKDRWLISR